MKKYVIFWFSLSLTFATIYGALGLQQAFSREYVVQDDARVYVFWMQRFVDPALLPQDFIADYFKWVTPVGYAALYQFVASLGIQPLLLSKLLPIVLGVITTAYSFGVCLQIFPVPAAAFIATLLINQSLWLKDDLISATPRAFLYPLFLAFLYYLLRKNSLGIILAIVLLGLFYAPLLFISLGILILRLWQWNSNPNTEKIDTPSLSPLLLCAASIGISLLIILPFVLTPSEFGPIVIAAEAKTWLEFLPQGRIPFFVNNPWNYWLQGNHSSIRLSINPPLVAAGLLLPFLLRYPSRFPLVKQVTKDIILLPQILIVSSIIFLTAHAVLFKLYLPSRYTQHTLRIVIAIAAGMAIAIILDAAFYACKQTLPHRFRRQFLAWGATVLVGVTLVFYPSIFWKNFPVTGYVVGGVPALYQFFQQQPKNILIASLAAEADNLPIFAQRSILLGKEYANPYHVGYYRQIRQRATDLIRAQYSPDLEEVKSFVSKYKVDFLLVERTAFTPKYLEDRWLKLFQPAQSEALANLERSLTPALVKVMNKCSVFETGDFVVLQAKCIVSSLTSDQ